MHELSLAQSICETAVSHAGDRQKIVTVVVVCGPLAGVVPDALQHCFSIVAPMSGLADARLDLRLLTADAACPACRARLRIDSMWAKCDECGHSPVTVEGGSEFYVKEIEVEEVNPQ
jgi:hydrogenase nickel incorporation protein HypA/HybF